MTQLDAKFPTYESFYLFSFSKQKILQEKPENSMNLEEVTKFMQQNKT